MKFVSTMLPMIIFTVPQQIMKTEKLLSVASSDRDGRPPTSPLIAVPLPERYGMETSGEYLRLDHKSADGRLDGTGRDWTVSRLKPVERDEHM